MCLALVSIPLYVKRKKMKLRYTAIVLVPILLGAAWAFSKSTVKEAPFKKDEALLTRIIADILEHGHYSPKKLNDETSASAFDKYMETLDYNKQYFLKKDYDALSKHRKSLDNELKSQNLDFYFKATELFNKRLAEVEELSTSLYDTPFDYTGKEKIETDPEKRDYFKTESARAKYWQQYAKYMTMNRLANKIEKQNKSKKQAEKKGEDFEEKSMEELEAESRKQEKKALATRFKRRKEVDDEDQFSFFINSIAEAFGPHSQYFPPQEKENFNMRMTGRLEGIGAQLQKENEYIKVVSIVPGSASWRQGELKENDLILKVAQGDAEPVDIVDAPMKEAISMIRGPKGTEVRLTVQKPEGEIVEIPIVRDVVVQEETYAKSALIENSKTKHKIGLIYLPSFYSKFGAKSGRTSSDDVRQEVARLKGLGVDGIVLDLRSNGGGSLQDAIDMAGHFFEKGPVVQVKDEGRPPKVYSDRNQNVAYSGPMIVMVNNFSASASEILAAALKDYNRAVIVGNHTFGKGTVQTMTDLNRYVGEDDNTSRELGSFKFTIQQFYRVNGASTQLKGVHPHIYLPNPYGYMEAGIESYDNALPWDSIKAVGYNAFPARKLGVDDLAKSSKERINKSDVFKAVIANNALYKKEREITTVSLNLDTELAEREEIKERNKNFKELFTANEDISISSLQEFKPEEEEDVIKEKKERWEKQLSEDYYLDETIQIMEEMIARK